MAVTYTIDEGERMVRVHYATKPSGEELAELMESVIGDPRYRPGFKWLVDRRDAGAADTNDLRRVTLFVEEHQDAFTGCRLALVVASPAAYGMGRMAQAFAQDFPVHIEVFRDLDGAERWLRGVGTPSSAPPPTRGEQ